MGLCRGQSVTRKTFGGKGRTHSGSGAGGGFGCARRTFSRRCVSNRFGNLVEHECQRGDRQPREPEAGKAHRFQGSDSPERRRQPWPVLQRHRADHTACGCGFGIERVLTARARTIGHLPRGESPGLHRRCEDRSDAPHGCDSPDAGAGVQRLRSTGSERHCPHKKSDFCAGGIGNRRYRSGYGHQLPSRFFQSGLRLSQ